ncbi:MAG: hypothetical protein IJS03_01250 [Eubacterium sp.]|nr:hypothetical protein [Eubacterium sp.]
MQYGKYYDDTAMHRNMLDTMLVDEEAPTAVVASIITCVYLLSEALAPSNRKLIAHSLKL